MAAVVSPPGGSRFTSCGSSDRAMVSSVLGCPPSVVTMCSVPIAPFSDSLSTPTTTAVGVVDDVDGEHAAVASSALLHSSESAREAVRSDVLGEALGLLPVAVEEDHDREP